MLRWIAVPLPLLGGCFGLFGDGGQSGTEVPDSCEEIARAPVTDLTTPADGLSFSAQDVLDAIDGDWSGSWAPTTGDPADAHASIAADAATVVRVDQALVSHAAADGQRAEGALDAMPVECGPYYVVIAAVDLSTSDGALAETFAAEVTARDLAAGTFAAAIDRLDVVGSTRPAAFDPADWQHVNLAIDGSFADGGLSGSATWQASNDPVDVVADTGGTSTVDVSGMTEGVGYFALTR